MLRNYYCPSFLPQGVYLASQAAKDERLTLVQRERGKEYWSPVSHTMSQGGGTQRH